jgi:perosamine synthetase
MIPVNEPLLNGNELTYVTECVETSWISSAGSFITRFETDWAAYCGRKHGISMCNGTVALEAAVETLDLPRGSEIIIPAFTIISCAQAVVRGGCVPVLVDSDPGTWCMDVSRIEGAVTEKTRAIMPVHIYGHPVDMEEVLAIADRHDLRVIEDAAESHGAEILLGRTDGAGRWVRCGGLGTVSCFSFFANKIVTTGEGGMVLTDDDDLARRLRDHRNLYFHPEEKFLHERIGGNFRLTNLQAAVGVAQIERIDGILARKREMAARYGERLGDLPLQLPPQRDWAKNVYWMYGVVLDDSLDLDARSFAGILRKRGVQTRPFFRGMHEQPVFHAMGLFAHDRHPVCERISRRGLYLPSGQAITDEQIDRVCDAVRGALRSP